MSKMTLEEILKQSEKGDIKGSLASLIETIRGSEEDKLNKFNDTLSGIVESNSKLAESMDGLKSLLEKIANRPDPIFPEPIDHSEVLNQIASRPDPKFPEQLPYPETKDLSPLIEELIERIGNEHSATRIVLNDLLNKDTNVVLTEGKDGKKMTLGGGVGSIRRRARWEIATFPRLNGTLEIKSAGDGVTFYLPFAPIKNSETIRLNGGLPMSTGVDYTITGNQLLFVQNQTGSQIEMRAQN